MHEKGERCSTYGKEFISAKGSMFLGRGSSFPIALEGALKLKELSIYMQRATQLVK